MLRFGVARLVAVLAISAVAIAWCGSVCAEPASQLEYRDLAQSKDPFGLFVALPGQSPLADKWNALSAAMEAEMQTIADCRDNPSSCTSAAALHFIGIVSEAQTRNGLARLGAVNRTINLAISPMSDRDHHGVEDVWTSPLALLADRKGDCEDYAIAKLAALRTLGVASEDLRLMIVRNLKRDEDHAVAAVRFEEQWYILDNRHHMLMTDRESPYYQPLFALDQRGISRYQRDENTRIDVASVSSAPAAPASIVVSFASWEAYAM